MARHTSRGLKADSKYWQSSSEQYARSALMVKPVVSNSKQAARQQRQAGNKHNEALLSGQ